MLCHHGMCYSSTVVFSPRNGIADEFFHKCGAVHKWEHTGTVVYYIVRIVLTDVGSEVSKGKGDRCLSDSNQRDCLEVSTHSQMCIIALQTCVPAQRNVH